MDPPEGSRLEKMKTRKSHSSYIGASGRNGKRTNGILYNYRVRFFLLSQVLSSLADLSYFYSSARLQKLHIFFRYGPGVLASAQAISEPACLRGDGLGHTRDLPRGRRLEAR